MSVAVTNSTYERAESLLGSRFHHPENVATSFGPYSSAEYQEYQETLPQLGRLEVYRDLGIRLIPGPPGPPKSAYDLTEEYQDWFGVEVSSASLRVESVERRWIPIMEEPHHRTLGRPWLGQQRELQSAGLAPVTIAEVVWLAIVLRKTRRINMLERCYTRTMTRAMGRPGYHLMCGYQKGIYEISTIAIALTQQNLGLMGVHRLKR